MTNFSSLIPLIIISVSGAFGGIANALLSDNGFIFPRKETKDGVSVLKPGYVGNIFISSLSAVVSWGLYSQASTIVVWGTGGPSAAQEIVLSFGSIAGAILVGMSGARWVTNEVEKNLLKAELSAKTEKQG